MFQQGLSFIQKDTELMRMMSGAIIQINVKPKVVGEVGLPKKPVQEAVITKNGVSGDYNNYRQEKLGGTPDQAVLIMTVDKLQYLNSLGWPIKHGDLGENFTVAGISYNDFKPGSKFKIGSDVVIQVTKACQPCSNLGCLSYVGKEKVKEFIQLMRDQRGWYARVLSEGIVKQGDPIKKIP